MTSSSPTSVSRYRPAILVLTGAAAAYAAYIVYSSLQGSPIEGGLHRSNALRRPNSRLRRRPAPTVAQLQRHVPPLGEFSFFGHAIPLDADQLISPDALRSLAEQSEEFPSPELIEHRIRELYETFLDRLLTLTFPGGALSQSEADTIIAWLSPQVFDPTAIPQALQRHRSSFALRDMDALLNLEEAASVPPTDLSLRSDDLSDDDELDESGQTLQRTLYHIAEDRARNDGVIHRGITCNACDTKPIRGIRWRCANCVDFDLCSDCEASNSHIKTHVFYKIRVPAPYLGLPKQDPVYPGRPHMMSASINSSIKKRLVSHTKMEAEEIEALWDQFTCLASTEWETDPNGIGWALDRRAFNQAFVPRYSSFIAEPNLIYDRIFAYYDTNHDGMIGFEEFVKGLDGMHSRDRKIKLRIVFDGYDVDGDSYISRRDVLRIFRAYYAIEKEATRNFLTESAEELSARDALDTIHSSQPLGSAFTRNGIPPANGSGVRLRGKPQDDSADMPPVVYEDADDTLDRATILRTTDLGQILIDDDDEDNDRQLEQAVRDRWARRQFYVDEEEGLVRPEGVADTPPTFEAPAQTDEEEDSPPTLDQERPRGSRSSSRVRFQDDVDFETRSNASTSSRPVGERWGGYEIPEPEKDLGKEVLYQITQQAFNELLNPMFQEKEDNAMDAYATRAERRKLASEIDAAIGEFHHEKPLNSLVLCLGVPRYTHWVMNYVYESMDTLVKLFADMQSSRKNRSEAEEELGNIVTAAEQKVATTSDTIVRPNPWAPTDHGMWDAKLCRLQLRHEWIEAMTGLATDLGWLPRPDLHPTSPNTSVHVEVSEVSENRDKDESPPVYRDPTMPQFWPNSTAEIPQAPPTVESSLSESNHSPSSTHSSSSYMSVPVFPHFTRDFGPFFIVKADSAEAPTSDADTPELINPLAPNHTADAVPDVDGLHEAQGVLIDPTPAPPTRSNLPLSGDRCVSEPVLYILWIDGDSLALHMERRPVRHSMPWEEESTYKPLERKIRREALKENSPLHIQLLASLETVQAEINERKGSGLLSFTEFEEKMGNGKLRFLEAWMDWVSF